MKSLIQKLEEEVAADPWKFLTQKKSIDGLSGKEEAYAINSIEAENRGEETLSTNEPF